MGKNAIWFEPVVQNGKVSDQIADAIYFFTYVLTILKGRMFSLEKLETNSLSYVKIDLFQS